MKTTQFKTTLLGTAITLALGISIPVHASQQDPIADRPDMTVQGQVTQPSDGQLLVDDVNRAAANETHRSDADDEVDAEEFVDTASAKGIAEIDAARIALKEGSAEIQVYANKIIADHTVTNNELKAIAVRADLDVADDATLVDRAKAFVLGVRDGESFDQAYVENQIAAHEDSIELFERAARSDIPEISAFARGKLPAMHEHLRMANALKTQVSSL